MVFNMKWYFWILIIGISIKLVYILGTAVVVKYFIPLFGKTKPVIRKIPFGMKNAIASLKAKSKNKEEYLYHTYTFITTKYWSVFAGIWRNFPLLFEHRWPTLWKRKGYIGCHHFAHLVRIFLLKSGMFKDHEIRFKLSIYDWCVHQYCQVLINGKWIDVDAWGKKAGIPFGKAAKWVEL